MRAIRSNMLTSLSISTVLYSLYCSRYLWLGSPFTSVEAVAFGGIALIAQVFLFCFLFHLFIAPLLLTKSTSKFAPDIFAIITTLALMLVFIDQRIYALYHFHFNSLVWNVISSRSGLATIHLSIGEILMVIAIAALIYFLHRQWMKSLINNSAIPKIIGIKFSIIIILISTLFFVSEKIVYAWADLEEQSTIIRHADKIPFYQPVTIKKFANHYFSYQPKNKSLNCSDQKLIQKKSALDIQYFQINATLQSHVVGIHVHS